MKPSNRVPSAGPCYRRWLAVLAVLAVAVLPSSAAALSLSEAEDIALSEAPSIESLRARQAGFEELAVAGGQLPDPVLRTGLMSLPMDSWELGQEAMTQVQVGLSQKFPRGATRSLRSEQWLERSQALEQQAHDQRLRIRLAVREEYFEVLKQLRLARINQEALGVFRDLAAITEDYYATGRAQQQDVLRAAVEAARIGDRGTRIAQSEQLARARLENWIGAAAQRALEQDWPPLDPAPPLEALREGLPAHPRVAALQQEIVAAETGIELARQRYKPEFGVDLTYGGRGGDNPDGTARADLFSVMVMMDLPLFTGNRQDRYLAAAVSESSAAQFSRDDLLRRLRSEAALHDSALQRQQERLETFDRVLLPEAAFNADAAFDAYRAALGDLTALMRARITEYELKLERAELEAEALKSRARLRYLEGGE